MKICIVGAGISGLTTARVLAENNYSVDVFEKEKQIGGNLTEKNLGGTLVHLHGPHIFHTNSNDVWKFLNRFTKFDPYFHRVKGYVMGKEVPIPFNFESIKIIFGQKRSNLFQKKLISKYGFGKQIGIAELLQSDDSDLKFLGDFIFKNVFKGYSEKQWGVKVKEINPAVLARVPINISYDDRYFSDKYQGIPNKGYCKMLENISEHKNIKIHLNKSICNKDVKNYNYVFLSSPIDEFFDYVYGVMTYRSLKFEHIYPDYNTIPINQVQTNFPNEFDFTRITRYGFTEEQTKDFIHIAEYPQEFKLGENHRYYPISNETNIKINAKYQEYAKKMKIIPIGRLGRYQYLNMDQATGSALSKVNEFIKNDLTKK